MSLKITDLRLQVHLPEANDLRNHPCEDEDTVDNNLKGIESHVCIFLVTKKWSRGLVYEVIFNHKSAFGKVAKVHRQQPTTCI